jgi:hypothetical protein
MQMMRTSFEKRKARKVERASLSKTYGACAIGSVVHLRAPSTAGVLRLILAYALLQRSSGNV